MFPKDSLLHQACEESKRLDSDLLQQVRQIGNQFLTHVELGVQEAAYLVLQMLLRRSFMFIITSPLEYRVSRYVETNTFIRRNKRGQN